MALLQTFIAPLLKSDRTRIEHRGRPICWLDELLEGGFNAPDDLGRPLVILVCGPPGAGKSLLLQQLGYMRSLNGIRLSPRDSVSWPRTVLISTEVNGKALVDNMAALGMPVLDPKTNQVVLHHSDFTYDANFPLGNPKNLPNPIPPFVILGVMPKSQSWEYGKLADTVPGVWRKMGSRAHPSVLIIDSLNVLSEQLERTKTRERFLHDSAKQTEKEQETERQSREELYKCLVSADEYPQFLFVVLDTATTSSLLPSAYHQFWEYTSDVIIRLDYRHSTDDYFMRHIEIIKARFQPFSLGRQLIKIFRDPLVTTKKSLVQDPEGPIPNIERGGIFVFPSEHFILSKIRAGTPLLSDSEEPMSPQTDDSLPSAPTVQPWGPGAKKWADSLPWPVEYCAEMVGGLIPRNHATALVGKRGLHKSYFGYQFLCDGIANGEHVCVLSFRDDIAGVYGTVETISKAKQYEEFGLDLEAIKRLVHVVYQRPGYVTPQELLHRAITAVGEYQPTRVLINAVDQWEAGYPLLADSPILLPCLIDLFNTQHVTSMIVGVEDGGSSSHTRGLTAKAEVVLAFDYRELCWQRDGQKAGTRLSRGAAVDGYGRDIPMRTLDNSEVCDRIGGVVLRAVRVPHGAAGLARGVLEYDQLENGSPAGLRLVPLAPEYPVG